MDYTGDIIEESLTSKEVLKDLKILSTRVEIVTPRHQTPWLTQWTLHHIEIPEQSAGSVADNLSKFLDTRGGWYVDFRNKTTHFVIFKNKIFKIDRTQKSDYDEMIKYGISVGVPNYQLPNYQALPLDVLSDFLSQANKNTYANETSQNKTKPLRPGSKDYEYSEDDLTYHDTYFGSRQFIGEEIVYKSSKPVWGMNYSGFALSDQIDEELFDKILRPALMSGSGGNIPVRGPKEYKNGDYTYTFKVEGDLARFSGIEEISKNGKTITRLLCHGGFIE